MRGRSFVNIVIFAVLLSGCNVSMSEKEKRDVAMGISKCWALSKKDTTSSMSIIQIHVVMNPDASIKDAYVIDAEKSRYEHDAAYKETADRAINALKACSPMTFLPQNKFSVWEDMELTFNPSPEPQP